MAVNEDVKREQQQDDAPEDSEDPSRGGASSELEQGEPKAEQEVHDVAPVGAASPTQMGTQRFVYAAYFAGAIAVAFLLSKLLGFAWLKAQSYKPMMGEPRDEIIMPVSALVGSLAALYYWYRTRARQLAEEVATEMSKVTWPTRTEVTNGTVVVIVTTIVSTVFFALMDKFWGFVTNLVYGGT
jgi:preprotein translocase subunit SecE